MGPPVMTGHGRAPVERGATRTVPGCRPRRAPRMRLALGASLVLVVGVLGIGGTVTAGQIPAAAASTPCPEGVAQCVTFTPPGCTGTCLTVTAGPTVDIGAGQAIYISATNATVDPKNGATVQFAYCPLPSSGVEPPDPDCAAASLNGVPLNPVQVPDSPTGTVLFSFPSALDPAEQGNSPIPSSPLIAGPPSSSFFCDNDPANQCAIVVTDEGSGVGIDSQNQQLTSTNTVVVPLSFAPASNGCPAGDPEVFTDSAFSLEHFIPAAVDSTCAGSDGVAAVNTATETDQVIEDFAAGGTPIAFTDDPEDPAQVAALAKVPHAFIPVAVSATVMAFLGGDADPAGRVAGPLSTYDLTPNMVAGLISTSYLYTLGSDTMIPPLKCNEIKGCSSSNEPTYDAFDYLNPAPTGLVPPGDLGTFFSSVSSGSSYQVTDWMCAAPNVPYTVTLPLTSHGGKPTPVSVADVHTATATLTTPPGAGSQYWPPQGDPTATWPYPTCSAYPALPALSAAGADYGFAQTPALQAKNIRSYAYNGVGAPQLNGSVSLAGFGAMDWSEASYFGLFSASLQNAAGNFLAPTQSAIDDALNDATVGSDGVLKYDYDDTGDAAAYAMPLVTYAVVPTTAQPADQAAAAKALLTNLVTYSHGGGSIPLPPGYVPLPDDLDSAAMADISKDIVAAPPTPGTSSGSRSGRGSVFGSSGGSSGDGSFGTGGYASGSSFGGTPVSSSSATPQSPILRAVQAITQIPAAVLGLLTGKDGWLLGGLMITTLVLLAAGVALSGLVRLYTGRWPRPSWLYYPAPDQPAPAGG